MSHSKFTGLADQVRKYRLEIASSNPFLARSKKELHGSQIPLPLPGVAKALDIYHEFDPEQREITWYYYSESGEFLLQFSFGLQDHSYEVTAAHPGLWGADPKIKLYFQAIQESLANHYPPLKLTRSAKGEVLLEPEMS
jgi:2C-methyl-D-erythritol 2,4-cyclodiphosphate synthase